MSMLSLFKRPLAARAATIWRIEQVAPRVAEVRILRGSELVTSPGGANGE